MICIPCQGTGLKSSQEVCPNCKGLGHDGIPPVVPERAETKIRKVIRKAIKKVVKKVAKKKK